MIEESTRSGAGPAPQWPRRWRVWAGTGLAVLVTSLGAAATASAAAPRSNARSADSVPNIPGLPTGVPQAATARPATLPVPPRSAWPFPSAFSHTEGSGRLDGGASLWTDFVYDDYGPFGSPVGIADAARASDLAPVHGGFSYPAGPADNDGADIFTAAVGYTSKATYWRIDWNTLAAKDVPIAEWTMSGDTARGAPATATKWPANAGIRTSSGIQYALIVSAKGARLVKAADPAVTLATLATTVVTSSRSFIVKVPTSILPVSGSWRVQLAAGLANSSGTAFETVPPADGGTGDGVNVYNVTFRNYRQEGELVCPNGPFPDASLVSALQNGLDVGGVKDGHIPVAECGNFWMENDQANTLAAGNVAKYSLSVDWSQLAKHLTTPAPNPTGYTNRWYVTPLSLGQGVRYPSSGTYTGPVYLGRVQPYAVYVPSGYRPGTPTKLTWILHSLGANLNQYGGVAPTQIQEECQDRDSICATTEGFSEGEWYYAEAEVDFWDVWHQLALTYDLDPDRTVMSGYSMGGWASYKLPEEYPGLFAQAMPLEGPVICGLRVSGPVQGYAGGTQCTKDGDSTPLLVNLKWIPYVMTYGAIDELVPFTGGLAQIAQFRKLGYRYYAVEYPTEDHMVFSVQNDFTPADSQLGNLSRVLNPPSFTFEFYPNLIGTIDGIGAAGRIGPSSAYWMSELSGRDSKEGAFSSVTADSYALRQPAEKPVETRGTVLTPEPTPAITDVERWRQGGAPATRQLLRLTFRNVSRAALDTVRAGLRCAEVTANSDGRATLLLDRLRPHSTVTVSGGPTLKVPASGSRAVALGKGTTKLHLCSALTHARVRRAGTHHAHAKKKHHARRPRRDPRFTG